MGECVLMLRVVAVIAHVGHENNGGSFGGFQSYASGGSTGPALPSLVPTHSKSVSQPSQYFWDLPNVTPTNPFAF